MLSKFRPPQHLTTYLESLSSTTLVEETSKSSLQGRCCRFCILQFCCSSLVVRPEQPTDSPVREKVRSKTWSASENDLFSAFTVVFLKMPWTVKTTEAPLEETQTAQEASEQTVKPGGCDAGVTSTLEVKKEKKKNLHGESRRAPRRPAVVLLRPWQPVNTLRVSTGGSAHLGPSLVVLQPGVRKNSQNSQIHRSHQEQQVSVGVSVSVGAQNKKRKFLHRMEKQKKSKEEVKVESREQELKSAFIGRESPVCPHWVFFSSTFCFIMYVMSSTNSVVFLLWGALQLRGPAFHVTGAEDEPLRAPDSPSSPGSQCQEKQEFSPGRLPPPLCR